MDSMERLHEMTMTRELAARADAVDGEARTAELTFSSETPYKRWFGPEILDHSPGSVDLTRLQEIGVLLFNHDADKPIGKVERVWIGEDSRGHALVKFDTDEESDRIFKKVSGGSLRGVSVGYRIKEYNTVKEGEKSKDGRFEGPAVVVTQWEPLEISIVSVPADAGVGVGRSIEDLKGMTKDMENKPETINKTETKKEMDLNQPDMQKDTASKTDIQNAIKQERMRSAEITKLCRSFDLNPDDYIEKGLTLEETRAEVLKELAKKSAPVSVEVLSDESDKFRAAAADGLAMRAGIDISKPADGAESFRGVSLMRLAYDICEREGGKPNRMDNDTLLRSVFSGGSGAFPNILANVGHKALMKGYNEVPATFQYWTSKGSNPDFKPSTRVGLGAADELLPMTEMGEFKSSETTDMGQQTTVHTFGREWTLTRKAIINDDLSVLARLPAAYGAAARRTINKQAYELLTNGTGIFTSAHKNSGTGALSIESLKEAKAAMSKQKDPSGKMYLNIQPVYLIVPAELEVEAATLIASAVDPTKNNAYPNPFANRLTVIADPNIEDSKAWYLAAAPGVLPGIEVTYLNGQENPTMRTFTDTDVLGIKYQIYMDFGVNLLDYRAFYKSTGE